MAPLYKEIGRGTFGVVFAPEGEKTAVKKTFKSSSTLAVEFEYGVDINFAIMATEPILRREFCERAPRVPWYRSTHAMERAPAKDPWWIANQSRLPSTNGDNVPNGVFLFQRIPPVPRPLQESVIRRFWKTPEGQQAALADDDNRDCMIQPYLQERWTNYEAAGRKKRLNNEQKESLRNFPAYLDDLQAMGIDCCSVARQIAMGLAIGHFQVQLDMTDVEFVIAGLDKGSRQGPSSSAGHAGLPKDTQLWLVDFDKCNPVRVWDDTLTKDIHKLALGICANDSYYPSPLPDTRFGWDVYVAFTDAYIRAGQCILQNAFDKVATTDEHLEGVLQRPAMVMREWTRIFMNAKRNNERELFDTRMKIRKGEGWEKPAWAVVENKEKSV